MPVTEDDDKHGHDHYVSWTTPSGAVTHVAVDCGGVAEPQCTRDFEVIAIAAGAPHT